MNDLLLDYTERKHFSAKKKQILIVIGCILIVIDLVILIYQFSTSLSLSLFIPAVANLSIGIMCILQAIEHRILYPKKYIHISAEIIEFKLGRFYKLNKIEWNKIDRVSSKNNSVKLHLRDQEIRISMLHFPSSDEKRIKAIINMIAQSKNKSIE